MPSSTAGTRPSQASSKAPPVRAVKDSDAVRPKAKLNGPVALREILGGQTDRAEAEIPERLLDPSGVVTGGPHPQVEIFGVARPAVIGQSKGPHDKTLNPV